MAIKFDTFSDAKRYRFVYMGRTAIKTEDGVREPYQAFDASPRWLSGRAGLSRHLVTTEAYAATLAAASTFDLSEHARVRGLFGDSVAFGCKADALARLLEGIAPVPDFEEDAIGPKCGDTIPAPGYGKERIQMAPDAPEPDGFVGSTEDYASMTRVQLRGVARELGLAVGGSKDELLKRIESSLFVPFEEE